MMALESVASFEVIEPSPNPVRPWFVWTLQKAQFTLPTFTTNVFRPVIFRLSGLAFSMAARNGEMTLAGSVTPIAD